MSSAHQRLQLFRRWSIACVRHKRDGLPVGGILSNDTQLPNALPPIAHSDERQRFL
ncbi:hypothetical protein FRC00_011525, partial [Tulasnella sp. 408]